MSLAIGLDLPATNRPMTLILASIRPQDVVLTADGRSVATDHGTVTGIDDHYQKLFPIPEHPVVIAHMGENVLGGAPVSKFVAKFIRHLNAGDFTIQEIADRLRDHAHPMIRATFREMGKPPFGVNFWVAGFSYHEELPSLIEVFWKLADDVLITEERRFAPTSVVPGGNGTKQISRTDWHRVEGKSVEEARAYHRSLMEQAIHAEVDHNDVGGAVHELVITPAEWRWTQPPKAAADEPKGTTQRGNGS